MNLIFPTDDAATAWALEWLRQRGFATVRTEDCDWRRPRELQVIYGLARATLHKRLKHRGCPVTPRDMAGVNLRRVAMTAELNQWLGRAKQKGRAL